MKIKSAVIAHMTICLVYQTIASVAFAQAEKVYTLQDDDVVRPKAIKRITAEYDPSAHADKVEGTVKIVAIITTEGRLRDLKVTQGVDPRLDARAVAAAKLWEFEPAKRDGKPVPYRIELQFAFDLKKTPVHQ